MSEGDPVAVRRRVMVALDMSTASRRALEAAAEMAALLGAELHGVLVEDVNLLRLAELPGSTEIGIASASRRALDVARMRRTLEGQARELRQELGRIADQASVGWSFDVLRGIVLDELRRAAEGAGVVAVGRCGSGFRRGRPGSTARGLLDHAGHRVVWLQHPAPHDGQVVLVCTSEASARRVVAAAAGLRRAILQGVAVLTVAPTAGRAAEIETVALTELARAQLGPTMARRVVDASSDRVVAAAGSLQPWALVVADDDPRLTSLIDRVPCSVLVTGGD